MTDEGFLSRFQWILLGLLLLICINYITLVASSHVLQAPIPEEGFENIKEESDTALYTWKTDPLDIYDTFYSKVYDQLAQSAVWTQAKVAFCISEWKKSSPDVKSWTVLDAGCGTGLASLGFAKMNIGRTIAIDSSPSMLRQAKEVNLMKAEISPEQKNSIVWRQDSLMNVSACSPGEITHAVVLYFTLYYLRDMEQFFRELNVWTKPGGKIAVEVVNKHKFDPLLESASPFIAFSLQKYSKERLRKSKVTFDKFEYEAEFVLHDPSAEFRETFRYKDGTVRRQKHEFYMPPIEQIVKHATVAGWKYTGFHDLTPAGFEYGYLLNFTK